MKLYYVYLNQHKMHLKQNDYDLKDDNRITS